MKIRNHLIAAAAVALLALPALAAQRGAGAGEDRGPGRHHARIAEYLDLTSQQQASARQLMEEMRERVRPLREEQRETREQLRTALEAANPDPAAVGRLVIAIDARRDEMRSAREEFERDFAALLTAEQRQKYESLRESRDFFRGHRGHRGHRGQR